MAPISEDDVVQINIYGATLSDMLHKGVNIPHLLGKYGYGDCIVFDVPRRKRSSFRNTSRRSFESHEETAQEYDFYDERGRKHLNYEEIVAVDRPLNTLLNCTLSTIAPGSPRATHYFDDADGDILSAVGEEVIFIEEEEVEDDSTQVVAAEGRNANKSIFANLSNSLVSFGSSVTECLFNVLDQVETPNILPNGIISESVGPAVLVDQEVGQGNSGQNTTQEAVHKEEKELERSLSPKKSKRKRCASPVHIRRPRTPSVLRSSTTSSANLGNQSSSSNSLQCYPVSSGHDAPALATTKGGIPAVEDAKFPAGERRQTTDPVPSSFPSTSSTEACPRVPDYVTGCQIVDSSVPFFDPTMPYPDVPFPDDFLEFSSSENDSGAIPADGDGNCEESRRFVENGANSTVESQVDDEFFDCSMSNNNENRHISHSGCDITKKDGDTLTSQPPPKKPRRRTIEQGEKKYNCQVCREDLIWRPQYGRNRFLNHVRKHFNRATFKCPICSFKATQEHKLRYHNRVVHAGVQYQKAVSCESPQDTKDLLELWDRCFPGLICPASLHLGNIPLKKLN